MWGDAAARRGALRATARRDGVDVCEGLRDCFCEEPDGPCVWNRGQREASWQNRETEGLCEEGPGSVSGRWGSPVRELEEPCGPLPNPVHRTSGGSVRIGQTHR